MQSALSKHALWRTFNFQKYLRLGQQESRASTGSRPRANYDDGGEDAAASQRPSGFERKSSRAVRLADVGKKSKHSSKMPVVQPQQLDSADIPKDSSWTTHCRVPEVEEAEEDKALHCADRSSRPSLFSSSSTVLPESEPLSNNRPGKSTAREFEKARNLALWWLGKRFMSAACLKEKIIDKGYSLEAAENAIQELQNTGLLEDSKYAEQVARNKWMYFRWSPRKIAQELKRLGVEEQSCRMALEAIFGEEHDRLHARDDIVKDVEEWGEDLQGFDYQLLETLKRRQQTMERLPRATQRRRLTAWMQYRGYDWQLISAMLEKLEPLS